MVYKKLVSTEFLISILVVSGLILVDTLPLGTVQASTDVTGIITSDTMWTKTNSPYNLTGPILVNSGVTLTIEAGVTVNLSSYYIRVAGTLRAQGSVTEKIYFTGGSNTPDWSIAFTGTSTSWNEQTRTGCIIEHAVIDCTHTGISIGNTKPKINNNFISAFYAIDVFGGSPVISNNIINGEIGVHYASPTIIGNSITGKISASSSVGPTVISNNRVTGDGQELGIVCSNAHVYNNTISGFANAVIVPWGNATIEKNLIINNKSGLQISSNDALIRYNTIANNSVGIETKTSPVHIIYNNIQNNIEYSVYHIGADIDVINNWWGTTDTRAISQSIHDFEDDFNVGTVNFVPFLTAPNPEAPAMPTSTPTPTPTPTSTPTQSPTSSPSPSPSPTASPAPPQIGLNEIEVAILIVLIVIVALLIVIIGLLLRKRR